MTILEPYIPKEYLALKINYCKQKLAELPEVAGLVQITQFLTDQEDSEEHKLHLVHIVLHLDMVVQEQVDQVVTLVPVEEAGTVEVDLTQTVQ